MGTKLYLSNYTAYEPVPNDRYTTYYSNEQQFNIALGDRDNLWHIYPLMMFTESKDNPIIFSQSFTESVANNHGWVKAWLSPQLEYNILNGMTGSFISSFGVDRADVGNVQMLPVIKTYIWKSDDTKGADLFYGTSTVQAYPVGKYGTMMQTTFPNITFSNATASSGDRICLELGWLDPNADGLVHAHYIGFNSAELSGANKCMLSVSETLLFMDSVYLENDTVRRGRNSLVIYPGLVLLEPPASPTISTPRWINKRSTVNEYYMIDDFERYTNSTDIVSNWHTGVAGTSYKWVHKHFASPTDLSDYDAVTFYARAAPATPISYYLGDYNGNTSTEASFSVSNIWERYEASISWGSANPELITMIWFKCRYYSNVRIDDIALLRFGTDEINETWMEMDVTDYGYNRDMKFNEIKVPYKSGKEVQFSGEKNAKGTIEIHDVLNKNKNFLYEKMQRETPLYFRHRNHGLPMNLIELAPDYKNAGYNNVSTMLSVKFVEIYDDTMR